MSSGHKALPSSERHDTIGQVFTPPDLIVRILEVLPVKPSRILDPACGNGNFLAEVVTRWPEAEVVGFDIDPRSLATAQARVPSARLALGDALAMPVRPEFDLVIGNPPFAAAFKGGPARIAARSLHKSASGCFDLAVPFIERSVNWLQPGGWVALVVTNKIFVKDYAKRLRAFLASQLDLREVWDLAACPVFRGYHIDVGVIVGRRSRPDGPIRVLLGRKDNGHETRLVPKQQLRGQNRWELYRTPEIEQLLDECLLHDAQPLGTFPGTCVRDGLLGRNYHKVEIRDEPPAPIEDAVSWLPVVGVSRVQAGRIAWDRHFTRRGQRFADPRIRVSGAFGDFCKAPKVLVRGVARRLVAVYADVPLVPMVAVRTIAGFREPAFLETWLNSPLASFFLQVTARSDRIPAGSFNISKSWLERFPVPKILPQVSPQADLEIRKWQDAYGV